MFTIRCGIKILRANNIVTNQRRMKFSNVFRNGIARLFSKRNLLFTNSLTSGGCMLFGDVIQQELEYQYEYVTTRYDWERCARMLAVGTAVGPLHHYYYIYLDKLLPQVNVKTVLKKIAGDQFLAAPGTIVFFFFFMGMLENKSFEASSQELKNKFKYVYMGDCCFWPPIQFINFYYLSTQYRVLYINVATMVFNIFLSFMKHYDQH